MLDIETWMRKLSSDPGIEEGTRARRQQERLWGGENDEKSWRAQYDTRTHTLRSINASEILRAIVLIT